MHEIAEQFPNKRVAFLVCSDEPQDPSEFSGLVVGFGTGHAIEDLYALACCDYVFGTTSTFSQWASFYGGIPLLQVADSSASVPLNEFRVSCLDVIPGIGAPSSPRRLPSL